MVGTIHVLPRRRVLFLVFLLSFAFTGACFAQEVAPALELNDTMGNVQKLESYRGKIVVLNFWATWCGPCAAEMSRFVETHSRYGAQGVVVLAASLDADETKKNIPIFMQKHKVDFPILEGATVDQLHLFGMGEGLPGTVFIDSDGHVFARIYGEASKKDIFARVDWLLGDHKGKEPNPAIGRMLKPPEPKKKKS